MSMPTGDGDLGNLLAAMAELQTNLANAETNVNARDVTGQSGGGAVTVTVSGEFSFTRVHLDAAVVDPNDVEVLEDLVLAAIRDAARQLTELRRSAMGGAVSQALGGLLSTRDEPELSDDPRATERDPA
jgi:DNA-binding YbaB/EbfC family protein